MKIIDFEGWIEAKKESHNNGYRFCHENFLSVKSMQVNFYSKFLSSHTLMKAGNIKTHAFVGLSVTKTLTWLIPSEVLNK